MGKAIVSWVWLAVVAAGSTGAVAEGTAAAGSDVSWHAGLNLRSDFDAHPVRVTTGLRVGRYGVALTLDPMVLSDGQADTDLLVERRFSPRGWAVFGGWRGSAIGVHGGWQWHEQALVGFSAELPAILGDRVRFRWGCELGLLVVKHGAGLPTDVLDFGGRGVQDRSHVGTFLRIEYGS